MTTDAQRSLFECPDCKAQAPSPGACARCPGTMRPLVQHASDCAVHNEPAFPAGECNCYRVRSGSPLNAEVAHETIGAMRAALIAAQSVIDATVHPRTATLIDLALNYEMRVRPGA